jgi:enoyl-CoA hydratase/carnithine racemase
MKIQYQILRYKERDHIAVIGLPGFSGNYNALRLYDEFEEVCSDIEMNDDIRVVIITDADRKAHDENNDLQTNMDSNEKIPATFVPGLSGQIAEIDRPVIAAVNGDAIGQGLELIMACDIRIASDKSNFSLPEIRDGLIPQNGGTQRLARFAGKAKALEMILTGEQIDAKEASRIGLVNKVTSSGSVLNTAMELAAEIASKAPVAVRYAREAIYKGADLTLDQALRMEGDLYLLLYGTLDRVNGIQSFKDKKKSVFQGE